MIATAPAVGWPPAFPPASPQPVETRPKIVETHVSVLLFAGDCVCKIRKPVRFAFADLSDACERERLSRREVELNRRFAPDVYLGTVAIQSVFGGKTEWATVMRRLPDDRRFSALVLRDEEVLRHVRDVAHAVVAIHSRAPVTAESSHGGSRIVVRRRWDDNLSEIEALPHAEPYLPTLREIGRLAHRYLDGRGVLFMRRVAEGKSRDGHGDLLAEDIFCMPDGPRILDCIEFDDALRYGDVANDAAFLAMDLERLGRPDLADRFLADYRELSGDAFPRSLADHYVAYRALVRAKVAFLRAGQGVVDAIGAAERLLALCARRLERARVRLVLIGGMPGAGKSTLAEVVADREGWMLLRSDEVRKELAGLPHDARAPAALDGGIYRPERTEATYRELLLRAKRLLETGESVVLDATWSSNAFRDSARRIAHFASADVVELRCDAPLDTIARRMRTRASSVASDATIGVAAELGRRADPWPEAITLDATTTIEETASAALEAAVR